MFSFCVSPVLSSLSEVYMIFGKYFPLMVDSRFSSSSVLSSVWDFVSNPVNPLNEVPLLFWPRLVDFFENLDLGESVCLYGELHKEDLPDKAFEFDYLAVKFFNFLDFCVGEIEGDRI